jgi:hypothetical protein
MKLIHKLAIASALLAFAFTSFAQPQTLRVSIPFAFQAGTEVLPAGDYVISPDRASWKLRITAVDGAIGCYLPAMVGYERVASTPARLMFRAYGNSYFLHRVEPLGSGDGLQLFQSGTEKAMAKVYTGRDVAILFNK